MYQYITAFIFKDFCAAKKMQPSVLKFEVRELPQFGPEGGI
jgi:hypothetical protein